MSSKGIKNGTNEKRELDVKKVVAVLIAFIVIVMMIVMIVKLVTKKGNRQIERQTNYYACFKDNKWGVIKSDGSTVIDPAYQELIVVPNSKKDVFLCTYNVNYETGEYQTKALDSSNHEIFQDYEQIEPMTNHDNNQNAWYEKDVIKVKKDGKYGIIDLDGNEKIPTQYAEITVLGENTEDGYIVKNDEGKYGVIDSANNQILEAKYEAIDKVHGNDLYVVTENGSKKILNKDGQDVVTSGFSDISEISDFIIYEQNEQYGVMDLQGNIKIDAKYEWLLKSKDSTFIAKKDGMYGVIDETETQIIPFENNAITYNSEAGIYILEDSEYNAKILNNNLEEKISGMFIDIDTESKYIKMMINDEYKYYNFNLEEEPASTALTSNNLFLSKKDDKYGFVNSKGDVVVDYQYEEATEQNEDGYAAVKKDGKWGSIDSEGNIVIEPCYDLEEYLQIDFVGRWHKGKDLNMNYYSQE